MVWAGGVTVEGTVAGDIDAPTGPNGRLVVDHDLAVPGHDGVWGVGDAAAVLWGGTGPQADTVCPQVAQVALQSGAHAARQVLARLDGRPATPFAYKDKGIMATIGRRAAITQFRSGRVVRGTLGWLAWLGLHLVYLIGFRNKIVVFINWSWRYLSWGSGPRIIVSEESVPALDDGDGARPPDRPGGRPGGATGHRDTVEGWSRPLEQIDRKVLQLFALVGESVSGATHALLAGDREAAKALADRDEVVDSLCHDIEELTLQQLTVAGITSPSQLRYLVTVIRMLPDLERNGDLAEHVARRAAAWPRRRAHRPGAADCSSAWARWPYTCGGPPPTPTPSASRPAGPWSTTSTTRWTTCT